MVAVDIFQCEIGHIHILVNGKEIVLDSPQDFASFVGRCQDFGIFAEEGDARSPRTCRRILDGSNETSSDLTEIWDESCDDSELNGIWDETHYERNDIWGENADEPC